MISKPGYYDLPLADYLSGACPEPELTTEIAHTTFYETPRHARLRHPRFTGQKPDATPRSDNGSAIHSLALGGAPIEYVGQVARRSGKEKGVLFTPEDWKTDDAKELAKEIRARGAIPLLEKQREHVQAAAENARRVIDAIGSGKFEQSMFWQTEGVWCRGRADWLSSGAVDIEGRHFPAGVDLDLKSVLSAERRAWLRTNVSPANQKLDIQMGLRDLGHQALTGYPRGMVWLLQEIEPPYDHSFILVSQGMLSLAHAKILRSAKLWRQCLDSERWPGYSGLMTAEPSAWAEMDIAERSGGE